MSMCLRLGIVALLVSAGFARAGDLEIELTGKPSVVFDSARDACAPEDMPDLNARAFRDAAGRTIMFALHDANRPLVGPDLAHLKVDCHVALGSPYSADPARYDDRNFVAATWTSDGREVSALVHHEYHADQFGICKATGDLACWYNTVVAYRSTNGGRDFTKAQPLVVAAAPFRQDVEQGRQRGFFNPSNIVSDGTFFYALISTTGWTDQPFGVCLFRTANPAESGSWRAFDGSGFTIHYGDPYGAKVPHPRTCQPIAPFVFPVGSLTFHRASRTWIALFQAKADAGSLPVDGFYYATSPDLRHWGLPHVLLAGRTLYNDLCRAGPAIINYPAMLDPATTARNYDTVGDHPEMFFAKMAVENCQTAQRLLLRQGLTIHWKPPA